MKKPLKIASKVLLVLAVVMLGVSLLLSSVLQDSAEAAYAATFILNGSTIICAIMGAILIYAKSDTAKKVGHGLTVASFVILLSNALAVITEATQKTKATTEDTTVSISISAVIMIVAAALLAAYYVLQFVQLLLSKGAAEAESPSTDLRIVHVKEWKQLLDEGIITQEEFEEKRVQILGLKPKQSK